MDSVDSIEASPSPRTQQVIESELTQAKSNYQTLADQEQTFLKILTPPDRQQILDHYSQIMQHPPEDQQRLIAQYSDNQYFLLTYLGITHQRFEEMKKIVTLEEENKPFVIEEITSLATSLDTRLDFGRYADYYAQDNLPPDAFRDVFNQLNTMKFVQKSKDFLEGYPYRSLAIWQKELRDFNELCTQQNLLKDEAAADKTDTVTPERVNQLKEEVRDFETELANFRRLCHIYRDEGDLPYPVYSYVYGAFSKLRSEEINPEWVLAIEQRLGSERAKAIAEGQLPQSPQEQQDYFQRMVDQSKDFDLNSLPITGLNLLPDSELVMEAGEIREHLREAILPEFLIGLDGIEFVDTINNPSLQINVDHLKGTDFPVHPEDAAEYSNNKIIVPLHFGIDSIYYADDHSRDRLQKELIETLDHEIGHNIHSHLTYDEMTEWEEVLADEPGAVTEYVGLYQKKQLDTAGIEDFSDTFRMFLSQNLIIHEFFPRRYEYMRQLYIRRGMKAEVIDPALEEVREYELQRWYRQGYTKDEALAAMEKNLSLGHH